jgi:hypothetical protein
MQKTNSDDLNTIHSNINEHKKVADTAKQGA